RGQEIHVIPPCVQRLTPGGVYLRLRGCDDPVLNAFFFKQQVCQAFAQALSQVKREQGIRLEIHALGPLEHLSQVTGAAPANVGIIAIKLLEKVGRFVAAAQEVAKSQQQQDGHQDDRARHQEQL